MKINFLVASFLLTLIPLRVVAQTGRTSQAQSQQSIATVEVLALSSFGGFLPVPTVEVFESGKHEDLATRFHNGVAESIPFGVYRMRAYLQGFLSEERTIRINQTRSTIIVGLTVGGIGSPVTHNLRGRVVGSSLPAGKRCFVKLTGVFSSISTEGLIDADGGFEVGDVPDGEDLVLVVCEDGLITSRQVTIPWDMGNFGVPYVIDLRIDLSQDHPASNRPANR